MKPSTRDTYTKPRCQEDTAVKIKLTKVYVDDQETALRFYSSYPARPVRPSSPVGQAA